MKKDTNFNVPPNNFELEEQLLKELENKQAKKQNIQSYIDFIPEGMFYDAEHQIRFQVILDNHKNQRAEKIPQKQSFMLSDLINLKKKRDLLQILMDYSDKIVVNKYSYKILKVRILAEIDTI